MKKVFKFFVVALVVAISCTMISWKIPKIPIRKIPRAPRALPVVVHKAKQNYVPKKETDYSWIWWVLGGGVLGYIIFGRNDDSTSSDS